MCPAACAPGGVALHYLLLLLVRLCYDVYDRKEGRYVFTDVLRMRDVADFIHVHPRTVKRKYPGTQGDNGWYSYTIADMLKIFQKHVGRRARASELALFLVSKGVPQEEIEMWVIRMYARALLENKDIYDRDLDVRKEER
jgi:hypothetical protein